MLSKRFTACCTMLSLVITQICSPSFAQAFPLASMAPTVQPANILRGLEIPKSIGTIEETFEGKSNRFVFFIQDAHTNLSAQKSIASIVDLLAGQFDISLLGQEGAEGKIDTALLRAFPIREATQKVMERYLSRGVIGGPEYLAVTSGRNFEFFGTDKRKLYLKNLGEFLSVMGVRDRGLAFARATRTAMKNLQDSVYSKPHRRLTELIARHQSGQIDMLSFVHKLKQTADENKVDTSAFYDFNLISSVTRDGKSESLKDLNSERLFSEIEQLSCILKEHLARSPLEQKLIRLEEYLLLIEHGLNLELVRKDVVRLKKIQKEFSRENIKRFLTDASRALSLKLSLEEDFNNSMDDYYSLIVGFYDTAGKRDQILAGQLLKEMRTKKKDAAVLVTGGFHKDGITKKLRREDISYAVISPFISEVTPRDAYLDIMKNSRLLLDNPSRNTLGAPIPEGFPEIRRPFLIAATSEIVDAARSRNLLRRYGVDDPSLLPQFVSNSFRQNGINVFSRFGIAATDDDLIRAADRWDRRLSRGLNTTVEDMRESLVAAVRGTASAIPEIFYGKEIIEQRIESVDKARSKKGGTGFGRGVRVNGNTIVAGLQILAWLFLGPRPERNLSRSGALALILNAFIFLPATTGVFFLGSYSYTPKLEAVLDDPHGYLAAEWGGVPLLKNEGNIQSALHAAEKSLELEEEGYYDSDDDWVHEYYYIMPDEARGILSSARERLREIDYSEAKMGTEDPSFEYSKEGNGRMTRDLESIESSIPSASNNSGEYRVKKTGWIFQSDEFEGSRQKLNQMTAEAAERGKKHYALVPPVLRSDFERGRLTYVLSWIWYVGHILATFTLWRAGFYDGAWDSLRSRRDNQESGFEGGGKTLEDDHPTHFAGFGIVAYNVVSETKVWRGDGLTENDEAGLVTARISHKNYRGMPDVSYEVTFNTRDGSYDALQWIPGTQQQIKIQKKSVQIAVFKAFRRLIWQASKTYRRFGDYLKLVDKYGSVAGYDSREGKENGESVKDIRIAMAQVNVKVGDLEGNFNKIVDYIRRAEDEDADVVVFPELALLGYPPEDLLLQPQFITNNLKWRDALVSQVGNITAIVGFVDRDSDGNLYNAQAIISNGELKGVYHKQDLPNYGVFDEARYFKPGKENQIFDLNGVPLCINVCEDIWNDEPGVYKKQAELGARLLINTSASPFRLGVENERLALLNRRVKETGATFVYTNLVGGQDELMFDGGSFIIAPDGKVLAAGNRFDEDLIVADIKLKVPENADASVDIVSLAGSKAMREKRPISPREPEQLTEEEIIYRAVVLGTRDYMRKNGFEKAVIGISGGIDSALVAAIAVDAIGKENVVGVSMPTKFNTTDTKNDAKLLAERLGIRFFEAPIQIIFTTFLTIIANFVIRKLEQLGWKKKGEVSEENLQARIRGAVLMFISNFFGALVLSTGNKSELAVGYATLYGDMAGGFAPIKDLPKTKVFKLARYINARSGKERIPVSTIERPPSAELKEGQRDTDSLPPYEILDPILEAFVEKKQSIEELSEKWDRATVEKVVRLVVRTGEHKRRQAPPGPKITTRAFGKDWRMPITNGYDERRTPDARKVDETPKRVGILGGTFNPIHNGHIAIAEEAIRQLGLDEVIFVPAATTPDRQGETPAPAQDRLAMIEAAIGQNPKLKVSDFEIQKGGVSYTIDTLRYIRNQYGRGSEFFFIVGDDRVPSLPRWKEVDLIQRIAKFVAVSRPGYEIEEVPIEVTRIKASTHNDISSGDVRRKVVSGEPIDALVPAPVAEYIDREEIYRVDTVTLTAAQAAEDAKPVPLPEKKGTALVVGKFAPFHSGHELLIGEALKQSEKVIVVVYDHPELIDIPAGETAQLIEEFFNNNPNLEVIPAFNPPEAGDTPEARKIHIDYLRAQIPAGTKIDKFYGNEWYGKYIAESLGAELVQVDPGRKRNTISSTEIRANFRPGNEQPWGFFMYPTIRDRVRNAKMRAHSERDRLFKEGIDAGFLDRTLDAEEKEAIRKRLIALNPAHDSTELLGMVPWDVNRYRQEHLPSNVGTIQNTRAFSTQRGLRVLDMLIRTPGQGWAIPKALEQFKEVIQMAVENEKAVNPDFDNYYAYITVDQEPVQPGETQRRPGAHVEGFITPQSREMSGQTVASRQVLTDNTYIAFDRLSTLFYPGPFSLEGVDPADAHAVLKRFNEIAEHRNPLQDDGYQLLRLTPYDVHAEDINSTRKPLVRTFVKIQFSRERFNMLGNTVNKVLDVNGKPKLSYEGWVWVPRDPARRSNRNLIIGEDRPDKDAFRLIDPKKVDFSSATVDFPWAKPNIFWAKKVESVKAELAATDEIIETKVGELVVTVNMAQKGDWKITTSQGDQYFLSDAKFKARYRPDAERAGFFLPISQPVKMIELTEPVRLVAPWGAMQYVPPGSVLAHMADDDIYAIHRDNFQASYVRTDASGNPVAATSSGIGFGVKFKPRSDIDHVPNSLEDLVSVFGTNAAIRGNINHDMIEALASRWDEDNLAVVERRIRNALKVYKALTRVRAKIARAFSKFEKRNPGRQPGSILADLAAETHNAWLSEVKSKLDFVPYTQAIHDFLADAVRRGIIRKDNGETLTIEEFENPKKKFKFKGYNFNLDALGNQDAARTFLDKLRTFTGPETGAHNQKVINTVAGDWDVLNRLRVTTNPDRWIRERPEYLFSLQADSVASVVAALETPQLLDILAEGTNDRGNTMAALINILRRINVGWRLNNPWGGFTDRLISKPFDLEENGGIGIGDILKDALVLKAVLEIFNARLRQPQPSGINLPEKVRATIAAAFSNGLGTMLNELVTEDVLAEAVRVNRVPEEFTIASMVQSQSGFGVESSRIASDLAYIAQLNRERPEGYPVRSFENPPVYTDDEVIAKAKSRTNPLGWAHPNLENPQLSEADHNRIREEIRADIKRFSPHTKFVNGMPRNRRETGMKGRGLLGRYGPNPAEDPVVLRHNEKGELEVLTIERGDGVAGRALPGGMDRWGDETKAGVTASRELYEETGIRLDLTEGVVVYEGPVEDWRDTNDAWIESRAVATLLSWEESKYLKPGARSDAKKDSAKWVNVNDPDNKFYARHGIIIANAVAKVMSGQLTSAEAKVMKKYPPLDITTRSLEEAYQAFRENRHQKEVYDLIAPEAPHGGNYLVAAGLEETLGAIRRRRFSKAHIQKLRNTGKFSEKFLKYLSEFIFEGDIDALQEGRVVSPGIPLLRVNASPVEIALLKDLIINRMAFSTNIATKTARISQAANGEFVDEETVQKLIKEYGMTREQIKRFRAILDFGQRRAQGRGATEASRAAVIGGAIATSNVKAAKMHYLEPSGTMAHFFIMLFPPDREIDAFRLYAKAFPQQTTLLVDTYDTIQGVKNAIVVAREMAERGEKLFGVRLDSGNIAKLSREVRKMLNEAGLHDVKIFASDDLDEVKITKLLSEGAELDGLGVGTNLITGGKQAYLDLKFVESKGERFWRSRHRGKIQRYIKTSAGRTAHAAYAEEIFELLTPVWRSGERVFGVEKPWQAHLRTIEELNQWSPNQKKLEGSAPIPVEVQDNPLSINPIIDAVLDVDVSTTFMPGGGLPVREGDLILPNVRTIGNLFPKKRRFASVDRHPRGHMSLASSYEGYAPFTYLSYDEVSKWTDDDHKLAPHAKFTLAELKDVLKKTGGQVLWTDHAEEGTEEGELHHQFLEREYEYVQVKGMNPATDSYSAFRDNVGNPTKLAQELHARGVKRLFVTGLAMDYCVGWSCEDAVKEGFEVFIVIDATRPVGFPEGSIDKMKASFAEKGIKVITTKELVDANNHMGVFPSGILPEPIAHPPVPEEDESSALEEDMYHLTMAQVLFSEGLHEKPATYDYFFRTPPYGDDKIIVSGVKFLTDEIRKFKFTSEDIEYLRKYSPYKFSEAFLEYLSKFDFKGDIDTLREGSVAFPREPIMRVKGTALEIIIETLLLKRTNFNNLMATWSNITRQSHGEDLRLNIDAVVGAQGQSHAEAMYSAFVGGSNATTDLDAHLNFGIPLAWSDDEGEWLGSDFITGGPKAALGGVYKLAEFDGEPRIKLSDNPAKTSLPGAKEIAEINDSTGNVIRRVIKLDGEDLQLNPGETAVPLLVPAIQKGQFVYTPPSIWEAQVFRRDQVRRYAHIHESVPSEGLSQLQDTLTRQARSAAQPRVENGFGIADEATLTKVLQQYAATYVFIGYGKKGQYKDTAKLHHELDGIARELDGKWGKGKWLAAYGGDVARDDAPDIGYAMKYLARQHGVPVLGIQADVYDIKQLSDFAAYVFVYPTKNSRDGKPLRAGVLDGKPEGATAVYFSKPFIQNGLKGLFILGGGDLAAQELDYARRTLPVKISYIPFEVRNSDDDGPFGSVHRWVEQNARELLNRNNEKAPATDSEAKSGSGKASGFGIEQKEVIQAVQTVLRGRSGEVQNKTKVYKTIVFSSAADLARFEALLAKYAPEIRAEVLGHIETAVAGWDVSEFEAHTIWNRLAHLFPRAVRSEQIYVRQKKAAFANLKGIQAALLGKQTEYLLDRVDRFSLDQMQQNGEGFIDTVMEALRLRQLTDRIATISA